MSMAQIKFPNDFIFGIATSAAQIEGAAQEDGKGLSIWDIYARIPGSIADSSLPDIACDTYNRYEADLEIAKMMNIQSFRFSFAWSRIFPEGFGNVNQKGLDFYKRMIEKMHQLDLIPNATVYHWDLPYALERRGGWLNRDIIEWFGDYASLLFQEFGNDIPLWSTLNEPIATYVGYGLGIFAPGRIGEKTGRQANHHILMAHGEAVKRFRQENLSNSKVGVVVDIWHHHPFRLDNLADIQIAELENEKAYRSYLNPIFKGAYTDALLKWMRENNCMPDIQPDDMEHISQPLDFFGLNCYNRVVDCADQTIGIHQANKLAGGNYMDNDTEFYPKAIYDALHILRKDYKIEIPIFITENGTYNCNEDIQSDGKIHDDQRIAYHKEFLYWIRKAMDEGIDVKGYYAWSLLDNWEWTAGYKNRFGLVHVDFKTQKRIWKDSAYWYQNMIKTRSIQF